MTALVEALIVAAARDVLRRRQWTGPNDRIRSAAFLVALEAEMVKVREANARRGIGAS